MGDPAELNATFPVRPNRGVNRGYQTGQLRADGTLATYTARVRADGLSRRSAAGGARRQRLRRRAVRQSRQPHHRHRRRRHAARREGLRQRGVPGVDRRAVPSGLSVVGARRHALRRGHVSRHHPAQGLTSPSTCATTSSPRKLESADPHGPHLADRPRHDAARRAAAAARPSRRRSWSARLSHPNGWWRDTAQQLLVQRGDKSVVPALKKLAETAPDPRTRLHALWTLDGLDSLEPATVIKALGDQSRDVRVAAVRLAERFLADAESCRAGGPAQRDSTIADWAVREQLAASLGELPPGPRETALASLLERHGNDPVVVDAALSGLRGSEAAVLANLLQVDRQRRRRARPPSRCWRPRSCAAAQDGAVQSIFQQVTDAARPVWQRAALLRGAEVALLGAAAPGSPAGRGGRGGAGGRRPRRSDPTAPGGRAGPGGAPAFPREGGGRAGDVPRSEDAAPRPERGAADAAARRQASLRLTASRQLSALAARRRRAWARARPRCSRASSGPANPGAAAPVAPLTADEQQRFAAGQTRLSKHLPAVSSAGRPRQGGAGHRVSSRRSSPSRRRPIPARILINGKEGPVGLMPPLGQALTDEQIASVLTYVRRQWGNTGSPVDGRPSRTRAQR